MQDAAVVPQGESVTAGEALPSRRIGFLYYFHQLAHVRAFQPMLISPVGGVTDD